MMETTGQIAANETRRSTSLARAGLAIATLAVAWLAIAYLFSFPPFQSTPAFWRNVEGGKQVYRCNGGMPGAPEFHVEFSDNGNIATLTVNGQEVPLRYVGDDLLDEVYSGGGWKLTLDPEANLYGPENVRYSNCS